MVRFEKFGDKLRIRYGEEEHYDLIVLDKLDCFENIVAFISTGMNGNFEPLQIPETEIYMDLRQSSQMFPEVILSANSRIIAKDVATYDWWNSVFDAFFERPRNSV